MLRFFRKHARHAVNDPDFGAIQESKSGSWEGVEFRLWGYGSIQVMIDAGTEGPSREQRSFVRALRSDREESRTRIEQSVTAHSKQTAREVGPLHLSSIYIPKSPLRDKWRVWFDMEGEEHHWYGAEVEGWQRIVPFAED